jgi:ribosomal protein L32
MAVPQQQQSSSKDNMIIGNMNSSMNQLMDENRYLQRRQ